MPRSRAQGAPTVPGMAGAQGVRPVGGGWSCVDSPDGSPLTRPVLCSTAARGRAPTWTGPGRTGRSVRGCTWTLSPWTTRTAEPRAARRPGPRATQVLGLPLLPGRPGSRGPWGRRCALYLYSSLWVFFLPNFCDFWPTQNDYKGFFLMKKNYFYWLGFLALLVQLSWDWGEVFCCQGPVWGQRVGGHKCHHVGWT